MSVWPLALIVITGLLSAHARATPGPCNHAAGPIDRTLCQDPGLREADGKMANAFDQLREHTAGVVRTAFVAQQRAWLRDRNRHCASAVPACLTAAYDARQAQLDALLSRITPSGPDLLADVTPWQLHGNWIAGGFVQLPGEAGYDDATLTTASKTAALPAAGQRISGKPGEICFGHSCAIAGLERSALGRSESGSRWVGELGLPSATVVFQGAWGNRTPLLLVQRPDGTLLAGFAACSADRIGCAQAFQVWTPQDRGARIVNLLETR